MTCDMPIPVATEAENTEERRLYIPRGAALQVMTNRASEVLLSGPAGTGKSRSLAEKLHLCCEKYPRTRCLMVRKTLVSLRESAMVTFEEKVVPVGHPVLNGASRATRHAYVYPNGSTIVCGGLDKPGKIFSTEWDLVFVQEAIELSEDAWEALTTRLRNNVMPFTQVLADTNPDAPGHWIKRRCDSGKTVMLESRHEDNPLLYDHRRKQWTPFGVSYLAKLDALTGPRKQRLRYGRWVQAEGVVYEGFDAAVHVVDRFPIPASWPRWWAVDFGFSNPFVTLFAAADPDGRLYVYREIYHTQRLVEDHARRMLAVSKGEPKPQAIVCDHDAEGRATLERYLGMPTTPAHKAIQEGIQAVAARLRKAGDGRPRLYILRDSVDERDPALVEAKKPTCLIEEMDSYIWNISSNRKKGEEPMDRDNHAEDALRYLCMHIDTPKLRVGGLR